MALFDEVLREAMYSKRKMFYHVSYNRFSRFEKRNQYRVDDSEAGGVFLTPSLFMIREYVTNYLIDKYPRERYFLYRCFMDTDLNIFNPAVRRDREMFVSEVKKDPKSFIDEFVRKSFSAVGRTLQDILFKIFHKVSWTDAENPAVSKTVKRLGFDGYESMENNVVNVLVFDPTKVKIPDGGPFMEVPGTEKEVRKFFDRMGESPTDRGWKSKDRKNVKAEELSDLRDHRVEDVFSVDIVQDGFVVESYDFSSAFDSSGALMLPMFLDGVDYLFGPKWNERTKVEYDGVTFDSIGDLKEYMIEKYPISDEKPTEEPEDDEGGVFF